MASTSSGTEVGGADQDPQIFDDLGDGRARTIGLVLLCGVQLMLLLDFSIVNIALPEIGRHLHFTEQGLQWVVSGYALAFGGVLLVGGRLADLYGRRRMFLVGLQIFGVASLLGGLSFHAAMLVGMRVAQGVGAAFVAPALLSLITTGFREGAERNRALGWFSAAGASGFAIGVLTGGVLVQALGWRSVLIVNVPLVVLADWGAVAVLEESRAHSGTAIDVVGAVLGTLGLTGVLLSLTELPGRGMGSTNVWLPLAAGAVLLAWFAAHERRTDAPLLPPALLRLRRLAVANLLNILVPGAVGAGVLLLSIQLQVVRGDSALVTGLSLLPLGAVVIVAAPVAAVLGTRVGMKPVLVVGTVVVAVGLAWCSKVTATSSYAGTALPALLLTGAGFAAFVATTTIAATGSVHADQQGLASGLINTSLQVGTALGVAVLASVAASRTSSGNLLDPRSGGYHLAMLVGALITAVAVVLVAAAFPRDAAAPEPAA